MITSKDIRKRLIEEIDNASITNAEICRRLGITTGALAQYKSGRSMPSLETLANLCKIIDVPPSYIMCYEDFDGNRPTV